MPSWLLLQIIRKRSKAVSLRRCRSAPELSFAVRHYGCIAGINITASHNPKEYNGYKVYWEDGAQLPPAEADVVANEMAKTDIFTGVKTADYDESVKNGLIRILSKETDEAYLSEVIKVAVNPDCVKQVADEFKLVYTPFHGAGYRLVPEILRRLGYKHIICEPEQMKIDGDFPTVKNPNPEYKEGFTLAIELAKQNDVDLIIGTDPDSDRTGIVLKDKSGEYVTLSGNQVGVLLTDYIITAKKLTNTMPAHPAVLKSIVTTEMARAAAEKNGVACFDTFTGFKFLAEKIKQFEQDGSHEYIFAFEESYGYLCGDYARDKDAVTASMLIAEMAAYYRTQGKTLQAPALCASTPSPIVPANQAVQDGLHFRETAPVRRLCPDPDSDRTGIGRKHKSGEYATLSSNPVGVLLTDYIITAKKLTNTMPAHPAVLKSIVTTEMARAAAEKNGVECFDTFTGFKFLAEKIKQFEQDGSHEYIFAFEESYGYLCGDYARDKDAVTASMLIAEMAAYYRTQGKTLYDAMEEMYEKYGCYCEQTISIVMPGVSGLQRMKELMQELRDKPLTQIGTHKVDYTRDYMPGTRTCMADGKSEPMELKGQNVMYYELEGGTTFIIRPSGTEPKVKVYIMAKGENKAEAAEKVEALTAAAKEIVK